MALGRLPAVLASVAALVVGLTASRSATEFDLGPLGPAGGSYGWSYGVPQGQVFTDGLSVLQNLGDRPVRLLDVEFEPGEPGVELVGAKIAGLDRGIGSYQLLPSFPPVSDPPEVVLGELHDLKGYVIPAGGEYATHGVELLLGVRKTVPGRATRRAVLVTYEVGGDRAVARIVGALALCPPRQRYSCEQERAGT